MYRSFILVIFKAIFPTQAVFVHSGGTNSAGCHTNSKTVDYHCHNTPAQTPPALKTNGKLLFNQVVVIFHTINLAMEVAAVTGNHPQK